jgi:hypothetical protein
LVETSEEIDALIGDVANESSLPKYYFPNHAAFSHYETRLNSLFPYGGLRLYSSLQFPLEVSEAFTTFLDSIPHNIKPDEKIHKTYFGQFVHLDSLWNRGIKSLDDGPAIKNQNRNTKRKISLSNIGLVAEINPVGYQNPANRSNNQFHNQNVNHNNYKLNYHQSNRRQRGSLPMMSHFDDIELQDLSPLTTTTPTTPTGVGGQENRPFQNKTPMVELQSEQPYISRRHSQLECNSSPHSNLQPNVPTRNSSATFSGKNQTSLTPTHAQQRISKETGQDQISSPFSSQRLRHKSMIDLNYTQSPYIPPEAESGSDGDHNLAKTLE